MSAFKAAKIYIDGKIVTCGLTFSERFLSFEGEGEIFPERLLVLPGFIDEHIHGAGGADAMDGTYEALDTISRTLAAEGTCSFLATTMTQTEAQTAAAVNAVYKTMGKEHGARLMGAHLEGPFISPKFCGAQPEECILPPDPALLERLLAGGAVKMLTVAPEREGAEALIRCAREKGIVVSVGHTAAKYSDVVAAMEAGADHVTHTFNAQSPLHHREIGTVGAALLEDGLYTELIADTIHVSPPAIRLLFKCKPRGKRVLITDAIRAKGLGDGESELGGQKVFVKGGEARLADGTLAGSVLRMNRAVKNLIDIGIPLSEAVDAATVNPARGLGIDGDCGSIALGKRADFTVVDENFDVVTTVVGGKTVYRK